MLIVDIHVMNGSDYYTKDIAVNFLLNLIFRIPDKSIHVQQGIRTQMGKMYQIYYFDIRRFLMIYTIQ